MGKRVVKWVLNRAILAVAKALEDPKSEVLIEAEFDLEKLFPKFTELSEVQQQLIVYGTKQKLMDVGAGVGDEGGKISAAKKKWTELLEGKWAGERVNATGAAETKKAMTGLKEASKAVTMQGLMLKQVMAGFPGNEPFTAEDAEKLQEFIELAAKSGKRASK